MMTYNTIQGYLDHLSKDSNKARFTLGVRANVQPKSSIPIGAKVEISPKGLTLGIKAEIEKKKKKTFQYAPSTNEC
jgi:hypothetical protein